MRRNIRSIVVIFLLATFSFLVLGFQQINLSSFQRGNSDTPLGLELGLDLQGGSHLVYQADIRENGESIPPTADQMQSLKMTIERRVNSSGLGEPIIQLLGNNRLLVQLPGVNDPDRAKSIIGETAQLMFMHRKVNFQEEINDFDSSDIVKFSLAALKMPEEGETLSKNEQIEGEFNPYKLNTVEKNQVLYLPVDDEKSVTEFIQENASSIPVLALEINEPSAQVFENIVNQLRFSMVPLVGSNKFYPDALQIELSGDLTENMILTYNPLVPSGGSLIPITANINFYKLENENNIYFINIRDSYDTYKNAYEKLNSMDSITFTKRVGKRDEPIGLTGDDLDRAYAGQKAGVGTPIINIEFNQEGTRKFAELTTEIAGTSDELAIILDGKQLISPIVRQPILGGSAYIDGYDFTVQRVRDISLLLESGRLPVPIKLITERAIDATLGIDSLSKSASAGLLGILLVLLFMIMYYRIPGIIAAIALILYAVMLLSIFKLLPVTLTLSGVAAGILSIGMAVDANILIFERMKEELKLGRTLLTSINIGFARAWPAIRDGNVSTLITCVILYWFADTLGATIVKGFAVTLAIGVCVSLFSALTVSRTLLRIISHTSLGSKLRLYTPAGKSGLLK
ncbi:MAG: protein translocase subunit SecD [SAR202 cluster bacterium]|nr:protein translocase subunit SecD [SAR202 cluster bacterium]